MGAVVVTLLMMLAHCNGALWFVIALQRSLDDDCFVVFMCALRGFECKIGSAYRNLPPPPPHHNHHYHHYHY